MMNTIKKVLFSKIRITVFLACIGVACLSMTHLAYASPVVLSGRQCTCAWEYRQEGDGNVLYIYPDANRSHGYLGVWNDRPNWNDRRYMDCILNTKHVVIQQTVVANTCKSMFANFAAMRSIDLTGLDFSPATNLSHMFSSCKSLTSLDLSSWDTSIVTNMSHLFSGASSLTFLDLGSWDTTAVDYHFPGMASMFAETHSLKVLRLGPRFKFMHMGGLPYAGVDVGTHWMRVGDGTYDNPQGEVFASPEELIKYQNERSSREEPDDACETYVRVIPTSIITYDKGSDEAVGVMASQSLTYNSLQELNENLYERPGYTFVGWKSEYGTYFADKTLYKHDILEHNVKHIFTAQWAKKLPYEKTSEEVNSLCLVVKHGESVQVPHVYPTVPGLTFVGWRCGEEDMAVYLPGDTIESVTEDLTLYTIWESDDDVVLTYVVDNNQGGTVTVLQEKFPADTGIPRGSVAEPLEGYVFHRWTCRKGDFTWVYEEPALTKEQLDLLAKKDDRYVSTVFTAHFRPEIHTVRFKCVPRLVFE